MSKRTSITQDTSDQDDAGKRVRWTKEDDQALQIAYTTHNSNWQAISTVAFASRKTAAHCENRWNKKHNQTSSRGPWTESEDKKLTEYVKKHGAQRWTHIALNLSGRNGKQCRERWCNHLDPSIRKCSWEVVEDDLLQNCHYHLSNGWAEIAKIFKAHGYNRTDNSIKNHWNSSLKKQSSDWIIRKKAAGLISTLKQLHEPTSVYQDPKVAAAMKNHEYDEQDDESVDDDDEMSVYSNVSDNNNNLQDLSTDTIINLNTAGVNTSGDIHHNTSFQGENDEYIPESGISTTGRSRNGSNCQMTEPSPRDIDKIYSTVKNKNRTTAATTGIVPTTTTAITTPISTSISTDQFQISRPELTPKELAKQQKIDETRAFDPRYYSFNYNQSLSRSHPAHPSHLPLPQPNLRDGVNTENGTHSDLSGGIAPYPTRLSTIPDASYYPQNMTYHHHHPPPFNPTTLPFNSKYPTTTTGKNPHLLYDHTNPTSSYLHPHSFSNTLLHQPHNQHLDEFSKQYPQISSQPIVSQLSSGLQTAFPFKLGSSYHTDGLNSTQNHNHDEGDGTNLKNNSNIDQVQEGQGQGQEQHGEDHEKEQTQEQELEQKQEQEQKQKHTQDYTSKQQLLDFRSTTKLPYTYELKSPTTLGIDINTTDNDNDNDNDDTTSDDVRIKANHLDTPISMNNISTNSHLNLNHNHSHLNTGDIYPLSLQTPTIRTDAQSNHSKGISNISNTSNLHLFTPNADKFDKFDKFPNTFANTSTSTSTSTSLQAGAKPSIFTGNSMVNTLFPNHKLQPKHTFDSLSTLPSQHLTPFTFTSLALHQKSPMLHQTSLALTTPSLPSSASSSAAINTNITNNTNTINITTVASLLSSSPIKNTFTQKKLSSSPSRPPVDLGDNLSINEFSIPTSRTATNALLKSNLETPLWNGESLASRNLSNNTSTFNLPQYNITSTPTLMTTLGGYHQNLQIMTNNTNNLNSITATTTSSLSALKSHHSRSNSAVNISSMNKAASQFALSSQPHSPDASSLKRLFNSYPHNHNVLPNSSSILGDTHSAASSCLSTPTKPLKLSKGTFLSTPTTPSQSSQLNVNLTTNSFLDFSVSKECYNTPKYPRMSQDKKKSEREKLFQGRHKKTEPTPAPSTTSTIAPFDRTGLFLNGNNNTNHESSLNDSNDIKANVDNGSGENDKDEK